jgi:hypothetical protein
VAWLVAGGVRADDPQGFARYQVIIDRSPFGSVAAAGALAAAVNAPTFAKYQLVAIVVSNGGEGPVQACIFDHDANRSYYLAEGESIDGGLKVTHIGDREDPIKVDLVLGIEKAQLTFQERPNTPSAAPGHPPGAMGAPTPQANAPLPPRRLPFVRTPR